MGDVVRLAGAYLAFCIGSGFATGAEIQEFFAAYGRRGLWGAGIALVLYVWMGATLLGGGAPLARQSDGEIWEGICGRRLGRWMDRFSGLLCFGSYVIMISGAGAALAQQWDLPVWAGRLGMTAACFGTVLLGLERFSGILGAVGPAVACFSLAVGVGGVASGVERGAALPPADGGGWGWAWSGVLYAGFMAPLCVPFLTRLAGTAGSRARAALGGVLGGAALMAAVMVMTGALLLHAGETAEAELPALVLAETIHPVLAGGFTAAVVLGIYSTAAPQLWMLSRRRGEEGSRPFRRAALAAALAALAGSALPFGALVGAVYPAAGYVGIVPLALLLGRKKRRGPWGPRRLFVVLLPSGCRKGRAGKCPGS